jgi:hypothetical protein
MRRGHNRDLILITATFQRSHPLSSLLFNSGVPRQCYRCLARHVARFSARTVTPPPFCFQIFLTSQTSPDDPYAFLVPFNPPPPAAPKSFDFEAIDRAARFALVATAVAAAVASTPPPPEVAARAIKSCDEIRFLIRADALCAISRLLDPPAAQALCDRVDTRIGGVLAAYTHVALTDGHFIINDAVEPQLQARHDSELAQRMVCLFFPPSSHPPPPKLSEDSDCAPTTTVGAIARCIRGAASGDIVVSIFTVLSFPVAINL